MVCLFYVVLCSCSILSIRFVGVSLRYYLCFVFFFFFKQKTAYEMRISDWSSECALPILGLELLMIPDEDDPVPRLYGHCQFARRATRRFIDDDEIEGCRRQAERRAPKPDTRA